MEHHPDQSKYEPGPRKTERKTGPSRILLWLLPLLLIVAGGTLYAYFKNTSPKIQRKPPQVQATRVDVMTIEAGGHPAVVEVMGTVIPSKEITLRSRVSGSVASMSPRFAPGGRVTAGTTLLTIDPADYKVALQKAAASLEKTRADLAIETGNQTIAREEFRLLTRSSAGTVEQSDLALRKPQLRQARASVSSAEADLRQAQLNLDRTTIQAPFNALILSRSVNLGARVSIQDSLATLVGTDEYWIEAAVPLDRLGVMALDEKNGSPAEIRSLAGNGTWQGRVLRITGALSEKGRLATLIVAVADPLGQASSGSTVPLMLSDYVSLRITGKPFTDVIPLPRTALRDGNTVWVYDQDKLVIRPVEIAWKEKGRVLVRSGLNVEDKVIVSDLAAPVDGMALRTGERSKASAPSGKGKGMGKGKKGGQS